MLLGLANPALLERRWRKLPYEGGIAARSAAILRAAVIRRSIGRQRVAGVAALAAIFLAAVGAANAQVQTLDRIVASVGKQAITRSDLLEEYRLERFVETGQVRRDPPGPEVMKQLRERLIDQMLIRQEEPDSPAPQAATEAAKTELAGLRSKYPSDAAFASALKTLGLTQAQLLEKLTAQQNLLRTIDHRLRPAAIVSSREVEDYYQNVLLPQLARAGNKNPPPLSGEAAKIREILIQKKMNGLLEDWLARLKRERQVELLPI
jgi:hypothetical protein